MKYMAILPLLVAVCFSVTVKLDSVMGDPHAFSSLMHSLSPSEVHQTAEDVQDLIDIGEAFRQTATEDRDKYLGVKDVAEGVRDDAQNSLTDTLGVLAHSEEEVTRLEGEKNNGISLVGEREAGKVSADQLVIDEQSEMDAEIARVDDEKKTLLNVLSILNGLLPPEESEPVVPEEEPVVPEEKPEESTDEQVSKELLAIGLTSNRKLLAMSRTTTLLSNPNFIAALANADPGAINQVIELVNKLVAAGEDDRSTAIKEHQDAVDAAEVAAQDLVDAKASLARISEDLVAEEGKVASLTAEKAEKQGILDDKQSILDIAQADLDTYQKILDDETARINGEKDILDDAHGKLTTLEEVIKTLE